MKIEINNLPIDDPGSLVKANEIIQEGGLIAFPTDTVYGIGVSAFNEKAIEKIYQVKGRSKLKAIPILISDAEQLDQVTTNISPTISQIIDEFWPGALTLILPIHPELPGNLSSGKTIGVRVPDHDLVRELLRMTGPLAASSANLSGKPSALTAKEVQVQLGERIDLILDGGREPGGMASTVLDCSGDEPRILREGPILWEEIELLIHD
jgi:tRNA threonylcarbamoyl adenosine modification protein (Sua5/YciO/YrdC/YwlC family)